MAVGFGDNVHFLAKNGEIARLSELLETEGPALIETFDHYGRTPFLTSVWHDRVNAALLLLEHGANPRALTRSGQTALHIAAERNSRGCAQMLLMTLNLTDLIHARSPVLRRTPMECAYVCNHLNIVKLFEKCLSGDDAVPVTRPWSSNKLSSVGLNADDPFVFIKPKFVIDQLMKNENRRAQDHRHTVDRKVNGKEQLFNLIQRGDVEGLQDLLDTTRLNLDLERDSFGKTPLLTAVLYDQVDVVNVLLKHGANPSGVDRGGENVFHKAAQYGSLRTAVELLSRHSLSPLLNSRSMVLGNSPLHLACALGNAQIAQLFLRYGADKDLANAGGETPESIALRKNHRDVLRVLIGDAMVTNPF